MYTLMFVLAVCLFYLLYQVGDSTFTFLEKRMAVKAQKEFDKEFKDFLGEENV